jgi:small-conductance mechanosensitive channel
VDLQERHQLDMAQRVQVVRARARPWRSIFALVLAVAGGLAAEFSGVDGWARLHGATETQQVVYVSGAIAFFVFGMIAAIGLSGKARSTSQSLIGQAHAGVLSYVMVLIGVFAVITIELAIARIDVRQLLVGGAVTAVVLGIAAQQTLGNLFAGLVLLFARPFRVGDHVRFRAGTLSGQIDGIVTDISLTYVRMESSQGRVLVPNSQALSAAVLLVTDVGPDGEPVSSNPAAPPPVPDPNAPPVWP